MSRHICCLEHVQLPPVAADNDTGTGRAAADTRNRNRGTEEQILPSNVRWAWQLCRCTVSSSEWANILSIPKLCINQLQSCHQHTLCTAPPAVTEQVNSAGEGTCPICQDFLERPVELTACQMSVCCMCLVKWLEISQDLKCPCCYSDHLRDFSTIQLRAFYIAKPFRM